MRGGVVALLLDGRQGAAVNGAGDTKVSDFSVHSIAVKPEMLAATIGRKPLVQSSPEGQHGKKDPGS